MLLTILLKAIHSVLNNVHLSEKKGHTRDNPELIRKLIIDKRGIPTHRYVDPIKEDDFRKFYEPTLKDLYNVDEKELFEIAYQHVQQTKHNKNLQIKEIVTHTEKRHADDYFTLPYLMKIYPNAKVTFIPHHVIPHHYLSDPHVIVFDVGRQYHKGYLNFDHHQDKSLPSSIILILQYHGVITRRDEIPFLYAIDTIDTQGITEAIKKGLVSPDLDKRTRDRIVLYTDYLQSPQLVDFIYETMMKGIKEKWTHDQFMDTIYDAYPKIAPQEFLQAISKFRDEVNTLKDRLARMEVTQFRYNNVDKVLGILDEDINMDNVNELISNICDIFISRDCLSPQQHTDIYINRTKPNIMENIQLRQDLINWLNYPVRFRKNDDFFIVIRAPFDQVVNKLKAQFQFTKFQRAHPVQRYNVNNIPGEEEALRNLPKKWKFKIKKKTDDTEDKQN